MTSHNISHRFIPDFLYFAHNELAGLETERLLVSLYQSDGRLLDHHFQLGCQHQIGLDWVALASWASDPICRYIMLAHNHPSGNAFPSIADIKSTRSLQRLLFGCGIRLVDHIIVTPKEMTSLQRHQLI